MSIVEDVIKIAHPYSAKGGSDNRRQQVSRMIAFARFSQSLGINSIGQLGKNHVIKYWKAHRSLSDATLKSHWYALCVLWELAKKIDVPPKPRLASDSEIQKTVATQDPKLV